MFFQGGAKIPTGGNAANADEPAGDVQSQIWYDSKADGIVRMKESRSYYEYIIKYEITNKNL